MLEKNTLEFCFKFLKLFPAWDKFSCGKRLETPKGVSTAILNFEPLTSNQSSSNDTSSTVPSATLTTIQGIAEELSTNTSMKSSNMTTPTTKFQTFTISLQNNLTTTFTTLSPTIDSSLTTLATLNYSTSNPKEEPNNGNVGQYCTAFNQTAVPNITNEKKNSKNKKRRNWALDFSK